MAILPIVTAPDARLKVKSKPVAKVDDSIRKLMDDMVETMYASDGIGLSAVQVGVHKRVLVMDIGHGSSRYPDTQHLHHHHDHEHDCRSHIYFMANPEIIEESEEMNVYEEGCLSFPGQYAKVERPKKVKVRYLDYDGKKQEIEADELLATCVQHEIDHLDGIVFVDHISNVKRDMILRKLVKQKKLEQKQ